MYRVGFFAILLTLAVLSQSEGLSGCGGSIKASQGIMSVIGNNPNFSDITVSLVTSDGVVQDSAMCSPQGFFFIPIYDIGEYELTVSKKDGWYVSPESFHVAMNEEGVVIGCEEKKIFEVTGFRVQGRAHNKQTREFVPGVEVSLLSHDDVVLQTTTTDENGVYLFENVMSGDYLLRASHSSMALAEPTQFAVTVGFGSVDVADDFIVSGFKISGLFERTFGKHAIDDIHVRLQREEGEALPCEKVEGEGCEMVLSANGEFEFSDIQSGVYTLTPFLTESSFEWDIDPANVRVHVKASSVDLGPVFTVSSFTMHGRVVDETGAPMKGVCVRVNSNGKEGECSDETGAYYLTDMQERLYMIDAVHPDYQFSFYQLQAEPGMVLPDLQITHYVVYGMVDVSLLHSYSSLPSRYTVQALQNGQVVKSMETASSFCLILPPGTYDIIVVPVEGVSFTRLEGIVLGRQQSARDLVLSPIAQTIRGQVKRMQKDVKGEVSLWLEQTKMTTVAVDDQGFFTFTGVLPGVYEVRAGESDGCWGNFEDGASMTSAPIALQADVREHSIDSLVFTQTGYTATINTPTPITAEFSANGMTMTKEFPAGISRICLREPQYKVMLSGCVTLEESTMVVSAANALLEVKPVAYTVNGLIDLAASVGVEVRVTVFRGEEQIAEMVATKADEAHYAYSLALPAGTYSLSLRAPHTPYLFVPASLPFTVVADRCQSALPTIGVKEGRVVTGKIIPALAGVTVRMTMTAGEEKEKEKEVMEVESDVNGVYVFPAIEQSVEMSLEAIKEGHIFHASADGLNFSHQKLSSLRVTILDTNTNTPVPAVLLSLSSNAFNSNQASRSDGTYIFGQLFPGEYFLQAQLKEYKFAQPTQTLTIAEGTAVEVTLQCTRVAFSAFGRVTTITGQPQPKVRVVATAEKHKEVAFTDAQGQFRIRGLRPQGEYVITVVGVEHLLPVERMVKMEEADQMNVDFVVLNVPSTASLHGVVDMNGHLLQDLHVTATSTASTSTTQKIAATPAGTFEFPALANGEYTIKVESSSRREKVQCEEKKVNVERNMLNEVQVKCEVVESMEMEVEGGGSFALLAIVLIAVFLFMEREQLRLAFN